MVPDFVRLSFIAATPLPNQGFPARFLAQGGVVAITPAAMQALDAIRPAGVGSEVKVFGLSESQIARRVKVIAKGRGAGELGVLQRPQRARGHGPERRPHPRDRTSGPLETRRRHAWPLHPRRVRRVSVTVSVVGRVYSCVRSETITAPAARQLLL